tara:strand:+ start:509 stop:973 length:465 start_codon:yes stop_codon:yes gene_type:complete
MRICFVSHFECGNRFRYDNTYFFDDYMISLEFMIIKYFSEINNHDFIVKALKRSLFADILKDYIMENKFPNIYFHDGKLNEILEECNLAIMDYPSSSILETNRANIPTLVLSNEFINIRDHALEQFNNIEIFKFSKQEDTLKRITDFISNKNIN